MNYVCFRPNCRAGRDQVVELVPRSNMHDVGRPSCLGFEQLSGEICGELEYRSAQCGFTLRCSDKILLLITILSRLNLLKEIMISRQSRIRESPTKEGCPSAPGLAGGNQGRFYWQGPATSAGATNPLRALAHCHREAVPSCCTS